MNINFPFYCYVDGYHNDPTLYHFKSNTYSYQNIREGQYPKICYAYLETFDAGRYHDPSFLTPSNSFIEAYNCIVDEKCDVFVDIGANCGLSSFFAYLKGAKKIYAFEPSPKEAKAFLMNNIPNSTLYQFAISDHVGFLDLNTVWGKHNNLQDDKFQSVDKSQTYCVSINYLFDQKLFNKIDFLKVDVEGHEYNVFNGINDENLSKIKNISVEIHGSTTENDIKLGQLFRKNLTERLNKIAYFDGKIYHQRKINYLFKNTTESFFYSSI